MRFDRELSECQHGKSAEDMCCEEKKMCICTFFHACAVCMLRRTEGMCCVNTEGSECTDSAHWMHVTIMLPRWDHPRSTHL